MSGEDVEAAADGTFGSDVLKLLALLQLNSADNSAGSAAAAAPTLFPSAARSKKRRSYSSSPNYLRRSLSRRANLRRSAAMNRALSLTPPSPPPPQDPSTAETTNVCDSSKPQFLKSPSPENSKNHDKNSLFTPLHHSLSAPISSETRQQAAAQAAPPSLRRSTCDPITPERYQEEVATADTPPQPPSPARTLSRCPTSDQDSKEYCGEAVWIEEIGGGRGLIVHFKCPCGECYEILLSGNTCYYKLI